MCIVYTSVKGMMHFQLVSIKYAMAMADTYIHRQVETNFQLNLIKLTFSFHNSRFYMYFLRQTIYIQKRN